MSGFTDKQKRKAVEVYLEAGATAAAQAVGCSRQAVYGWLALYGLDTVTDQEKRQATAARHAEKRAALAEAFLDQSLTLSLAADPSLPLDAQRLMTAAAIASQKHLELTGGHVVPGRLTMEQIDLEMTRLEGELANEPIDRELTKTFGEWEKQLRHEIRTEYETENRRSQEI